MASQLRLAKALQQCPKIFCNFVQKVLAKNSGKSLHKQSHGESFLSVVENRFGGKGIYILDEPEAALCKTIKQIKYDISTQR